MNWWEYINKGWYTKDTCNLASLLTFNNLIFPLSKKFVPEFYLREMREAYMSAQGILYSGYIRWAPNVTDAWWKVKSKPGLEIRTSGVPCQRSTHWAILTDFHTPGYPVTRKRWRAGAKEGVEAAKQEKTLGVKRRAPPGRSLLPATPHPYVLASFPTCTMVFGSWWRSWSHK